MDLIEYKTASKNKVVNRHPWELARLSFIISKLKSTFKDQSKVYHFLDLGCGDTFVAEQIKKEFPQSLFYCVDSAFLDEHLKAFKTKNIFLYKDLDIFDKEAIKIDMVFLFDVLEHVKDETRFLQTIYNLKGFHFDSLFFLTVPAFQSLFTHHDTVLGHFRRYTAKTLQTVLTKNKFTKQDTGYLFFSLLLPRWISKKNEKTQKNISKTKVSNWDKNSFITEIITTLLIIDYKICSFLQTINIPVIGLSYFSICKKTI